MFLKPLSLRISFPEKAAELFTYRKFKVRTKVLAYYSKRKYTSKCVDPEHKIVF